MDSRLNMSLDDLIKSNKSSSSRATARGGGRSGPGPARRFTNRPSNRAAPYSIKAPDTYWQHDMYGSHGRGGSAAGGGSSIETGTKLLISNLDYGVSNDDIKELFAEVGDLKRYGVHYDRSGRSKGTAEVVFSRRIDAVAAVKRYNNVELDGKPMKAEIVGTNISAAGNQQVNGPPRKPYGFSSSGQGRGRGRGGRGFARGRGRERGRGEKVVSAEQLDAELEKYHSESMQTN